MIRSASARALCIHLRTLLLPALGLLAACPQPAARDDCLSWRSNPSTLKVYPTDGDGSVPRDVVVRVVGGPSAELYEAERDTFEVTVHRHTIATTEGDVTELAPWSTLRDDTEYQVRVDDEVVSTFRTSSSGGEVGRPSGEGALVVPEPDAEYPCCGDTCRGGLAVELPWSGDATRDELVLVDVDEQTNGVCGATSHTVATLALAWPGDGDGRLRGAFDVPLSGCYELTLRPSTIHETPTSLAALCTDGSTFDPAPRPDTEQCRPKGGCQAAPGATPAAWAALAALLVALRRRPGWRRVR